MIVERMPSNIIARAKADISTRTMEMFRIQRAPKVKRETYWVNQTARSGCRTRPPRAHQAGRVACGTYWPTTVQAAHPHPVRLGCELFLEVMKNSPVAPPGRLQLGRGPDDRPTTNDHPVTVTLKDASGVNWWATRTVRANYVVGCDGAHSAVRKSIGGALHGDAAAPGLGRDGHPRQHRLPDVRQKCLISLGQRGQRADPAARGAATCSACTWSSTSCRPDEKAASRKFTQDDMIAAANRIIRPYSIDVKEVVWWSIYDIGHSITDKFDDVPEGSQPQPARVHRGRRLPHPLAQGGPGHERLDAGHLQPGLEAGARAAGPGRRAACCAATRRSA